MRKRILPAIAPMGLGLSFSRIAGNSRFDSYYKPDVFTLVGSGMLIGVGLVFLFLGKGRGAADPKAN